MRVLHVIPGLSLKDGGPTTALHRMAAASAAIGMHVTVATTDDDAGGRLDVPLGRATNAGGVAYWYFARSMPISWKPSWPLTLWLARNVARFDVVHVHALFSYTTIIGCRLAFRAGVPVVLRPLGTATPWSLAHHGWKKRPYFSLIERSHLRRAAAIHTTSEAERMDIAALGFGGRAVVIPLGVDAVDSLQRERAPEAPLRLLFLSRLHPKKNVAMLIDSVTDARRAGARVELTVAGDGEPAFRRELEAHARASAANGAIRFVGHVAGDEKRALLAASDAYALPSHQENFGIAVAEALAAGLPVIVSDQVGIAPEIAASGAGTVIPVDRAALSSAIIAMAANVAARLSMGERARTLAADRYSWSLTASMLGKLYADVILKGNTP